MQNISDDENLFEIMQNDAISAIALHSFTLGYHNISRNKKSKSHFPKIDYMFYVLPIVYNLSSMQTFLNSNELYTALIKETSIILGLQERANKMATQTFNGLNLAFSKKILGINKEDNTIILVRPFSARKLQLTMSAYNSFNSVKKIQDSAYKIGSIFAKINDRNIQYDLNIIF